MSDEAVAAGRTTASPGQPTGTDPDVSRSRRLAEILLTCCAVVSIVMMWRGLLPVVQGTVVPLPSVVVATAAVALLMRRRGRGQRSVERRLVVMISALALVVGLVTLVFEALDSTTYRVLPGASQKGCHVVVREYSFVMAGGGSLYVLGGETGIARRVKSFQTDDGERPFAYGYADVVWDGEEATVNGPLWDPKHVGPSTFGC